MRILQCFVLSFFVFDILYRILPVCREELEKRERIFNVSVVLGSFFHFSRLRWGASHEHRRLAGPNSLLALWEFRGRREQSRLIWTPVQTTDPNYQNHVFMDEQTWCVHNSVGWVLRFPTGGVYSKRDVHFLFRWPFPDLLCSKSHISDFALDLTGEEWFSRKCTVIFLYSSKV